MRDLIDGVALSKAFQGILFHGTPEHKLVIDHENGSLFTTFDDACNYGPNVFECRVTLRRPHILTSADNPHELITNLTHEGYDGCIMDQGGVRKVIVFDAKSITLLKHHDAGCDLDEMDIEHNVILKEFRPGAGQHVLMITGNLAKSGLERVMSALGTEDFTYEISNLDIAVAAWITTDLIKNSIDNLEGVDLIMIPGKITGDEEQLAKDLGVKVIRGPVCYSELPVFLERHGVEIDPEGIVRPKIIMLGDEAEYAEALSKTYEVPHLTVHEMLATLGSDDVLVQQINEFMSDGAPVPHYLMAELVRSRLVMQDVQKGYVLDGYPHTPRDAVWMDEINPQPDVIVAMGSADPEVVVHYYDNPALVEVDSTVPERTMSNLYTGVETLMRQCVKPGMAYRKT
jgi:hypothetical protein